jgi:energy-coupling factor transport system ATP-binding protein
MAMQTRAANLEHVRFRYRTGDPAVLDGVEWEIDEGSFTVVTGVSGSGKSTLLRALNGLVPHFTGGTFGGRVLLAGHDTRDVPIRDLSRSAGFVFQDPEAQAVTGLVDDEIAFGMEQLGVPPASMRRQVEEALDLLGIAHVRSRETRTLSGGERQRVAIAAALAMGPRMMILDEPTSQLDPAAADDLVLTLHRLHDDLGMTVVIAEHRLERVVRYADRLRVLDASGGQVHGEPRAVLRTIDSRLAPAVVRLGRRLDWDILPLTVREARSRAADDAPLLPPPPEDPPRPFGTPGVVTEKLTLAFGKQTVLRKVDFDVYPGEIVALMGRNGSGKTTLLRALAGLHPPASGLVAIAGAGANASPEARARVVGYLPQRARALLFNETAGDEVRFTLRHRGADPAGAGDMLEEFGLTHLEDRHPFDLSAGQQERLAIAATLAGEPPVLLLDEPTRGMDAIAKAALAESLRRRALGGAAIVMATHDVELAATIATRVVVLGDERVIAAGGPREVLAGSLKLAPQINRVFGASYLTMDDLFLAE